MEDELRRRVVGQEEALEAVSKAVRRRAPGCRTRTGRSAPSCSSAHGRRQDRAGEGRRDFLFDDDRAMTRIDMSEYMEKHASPA
jgi:ATP-dependent Clp protease ATP-binding subunit ClpB